MASPSDGDLGPDESNPYASANKWRHQESTAYSRHARLHPPHPPSHAAVAPRDASGASSTGDLADFLNRTRVEPPPDAVASSGGHYKPITIPAEAGAGAGLGPEAPAADGREIACGPLLNYRSMSGGRWVGSVLIVVKGGGKQPPPAPTLELRRAGVRGHEEEVPGHEADSSADAADEAAAAASAPAATTTTPTQVQGCCLYSDPRCTFWQFDIAVAVERAEVAWEYTVPDLRFPSAGHQSHKPQRNRFHVPALAESMRIMFHSCNGFSVGTDEAAWCGPALWQDVLRRHADAPFHVMIGGGDQIYNDGIRVGGPLREWADMGNPKRRATCPFPEKLRQECDDYYLENYLRWYSTGAFATANGQIPQVNIWDDHDIIDGFGSYVDAFMRCDVFRGIGGTAHKYYMLFQHHLPPPPSTYTTDVPATMAEDGQGIDPTQLADTFVAAAAAITAESPYIRGPLPGPYVAEHSLSLYARLGARIALVGIDARTERTRHQVNHPETYDAIFTRLDRELRAAAAEGTPIRHVILLLGIPVAYPRLTWLENVLRSPVIGPIKFLNRRFGLGGALFNRFDGSVDLLDDLDDHYTARTHKHERRRLVDRLQETAGTHSVRVTMLGGDVHLAALGRFYSNLRLQIPTGHDHRYMVNVVSSAITNKPPPPAIANLLARRNKIHHLDENTDETMLDLFDRAPETIAAKVAGHNHCTMPSRNYAVLTENSPTAAALNGSAGPGRHRQAHGNPNPGPEAEPEPEADAFPIPKNGHSPLHAGEVGAGTGHRAAGSAIHGQGRADGSLDVCIWVEVDQHDPAGRTAGYGMTVPALESKVELVVKPAPAPATDAQ